MERIPSEENEREEAGQKLEAPQRLSSASKIEARRHLLDTGPRVAHDAVKHPPRMRRGAKLLADNARIVTG